jgi:hypothetical protein
MFTGVGLLGMTGIIINDSIVLVTTIDQRATDRGLIPAIIDGAADRLRAVMLTTLTTVLGLAPLLYETSSQAQFLKPTVITLVYGLGFGMVLVLLVVPALMAMQRDVGRQIGALRRSLRMRRTAAVMRMAAVVSMVWMAATLGWVVWQGQLPGLLAGLLPGLAQGTPLLAALLLFLAGFVAVLSITVAVVMWRQPRARRSASALSV